MERMNERETTENQGTLPDDDCQPPEPSSQSRYDPDDDSTKKEKWKKFYTDEKIEEVQKTQQKYLEEKGLLQLINFVKIGSSTFLLNRFLEDPNLPDIEIHGLAHFNQYSTFTLKVALEELIGDYESCLTATVEVHSWIKQITTLTIDFFKEWNQYSNVSSLPIVQMSLKCSGILEVMKNSNEKCDKLDKKFDVAMEKTRTFIPTLPGVDSHLTNQINDNMTNIEYYEADLTAIDEDKNSLEREVDEKKKDVTAAKADQKDLEKELNSIAHSLWLALHSIIIETALSSVPVRHVIDKIILENREIDRKRLEEAKTNVSLMKKELYETNKKNENYFEDKREKIENLKKKIDSCRSENESMQKMINCAKQLINYLHETRADWNIYKKYIWEFIMVFSNLNNMLEKFATYNDKDYSLHELSPHVLEIIGYCYSLQNIAEIHENISHKFVNPIDFSFFNDLTMEQVEVEIQKNLEEANKYLKLELENAKENVPNNIVDFARLYSKTTKATEAKEEEPKI